MRAGRLALRLVVALLLGFVALPALVAVVAAFDARSVLVFPPEHLSLRWFARALTYEDFRLGAANSLVVAGLASSIALVVGGMAAYALHRYRFPGRGALAAALTGPLVVPHFLVGLGFLILVSGAGLSRGLPLVVACHVVLVLPFVLRSVLISVAALDPRLEDAALSLGATPGRVLREVTLPLLAPGLAGGWLFAAILSFTEFSASLFVTSQATQTLPVAMYGYVREYADPSMAALAALSLAATTLLLVGVELSIGLGRVLGLERGGG